MGFIASPTPPDTIVSPVYWFCFQKNNLLVETLNNRIVAPAAASANDLGLDPLVEIYLGRMDGRDCFAAELPADWAWPDSLTFMDLRMLHGMMDPDFLKAAVTAIQVLAWDQTFRYCGRCGTPTQNQPLERAKICPACGLVNFPRLAPAIMAAVIRDNEILLANGRGFPSRFFSVLAGFVEPGETLEECFEREVREEVGLEIQNIRYFGSQPWPFPNSLMVAFSAEYRSGDIRVDGTEIKSADWFKAGNLPPRPDARISISGRLIDWFENTAGGNRG